MTAPVAGPAARDLSARAQLSSLRALLVLSMLMTEQGDEREILNLVTTAVPSLGSAHTEGVYLDGSWRALGSSGRRPGTRTGLESQLAALKEDGGAVEVSGQAWGWAYSLTSRGGAAGYLLVAAADEPQEHERFLLRALTQHTAVALANARLHARQRTTAEDLRVTNEALERSMKDLQRSMDIHARLTRVAVAGEGQEGLARAVHELTGLPVAIEDRWGNLRAWHGPGRPDPYPKETPARREQTLARVLAAGRPVRENGRLWALARPREDVLGVLALVDPKGTAGEQEQVALEHAATVLAMELARLRSLAESELRLRRDLVEELLAGTDRESALGRAEALGYDLLRTHRVVAVECRNRNESDEAFFHVVRRAARDCNIGSLLVARGGAVVVLAVGEPDWEQFRQAALNQMRTGNCRMGVGGACEAPDDYPRSYREAQLALTLQKAAGGLDQVTVFDDLGVYQVLSQIPDTGSVERFVHQWLGPLLDYDARKRSSLVATLSGYLECGGNYDATAKALSVHRSTLKYRLQRIREVSGYDLSDADTHFNLQLATRAWGTLEAMRHH
jgi:DNA-binding PucR family transcriptional regulator